jgi:hypothetical protein
MTGTDRPLYTCNPNTPPLFPFFDSVSRIERQLVIIDLRAGRVGVRVNGDGIVPAGVLVAGIVVVRIFDAK